MNLINRFLWHYWWGQTEYLRQRLEELEAELEAKAELEPKIELIFEQNKPKKPKKPKKTL